ncbi:hypothetical protein PDJAM_G00196200, partial [Pangasius djambal]|nr:hypothetical protein [Pangasius djambal]
MRFCHSYHQDHMWSAILTHHHLLCLALPLSVKPLHHCPEYHHQLCSQYPQHLYQLLSQYLLNMHQCPPHRQESL